MSQNDDTYRAVRDGVALHNQKKSAKAHEKMAREAELTRRAAEKQAAAEVVKAQEAQKQTASIERQESLVAQTEQKKQEMLDRELLRADRKDQVEATQRELAKQAYQYETALKGFKRTGITTMDEYLDYLELSKKVCSMRDENKDFLEEHFSRETVEGIDKAEDEAYQLSQSLQLSEFEDTVDSITENFQRQNQLRGELNEISAARREIKAMLKSNQRNVVAAEAKIEEARGKREALTGEATAGWANLIAKWKNQVSDSTLVALENKQPQDLSLETPPTSDGVKRLACLVVIPAAVYCALALSI